MPSAGAAVHEILFIPRVLLLVYCGNTTFKFIAAAVHEPQFTRDKKYAAAAVDEPQYTRVPQYRTSSTVAAAVEPAAGPQLAVVGNI